VRAHLPAGARVRGVVFQGMGEPLANLDRVLAAIAVLSDPSALAIDARAITVCTAGLPAGIRRLAREAPAGPPRPLARQRTSRGAPAVDADRRDVSALEDVIAAAARARAASPASSPMWAVTPPARRQRQCPDDAAALAALVERLRTRAPGCGPRLSVIPYNAIGADDPFTPQPRRRRERLPRRPRRPRRLHPQALQRRR
jgi:23S rRNA (adenine2503-C2)-methyltransferase